ncbi:hypothetical protein U0070_022820 [Myodes glareolus]|uniref:Uncharacterized protein n=1 Tax=Myodes glareolus TaxID=447135 RepID=A0AAW0K7A4_MYOGA
MCAPGHYGKVIGLPGDCTPYTCPHQPPFQQMPLQTLDTGTSMCPIALSAGFDSFCSTELSSNRLSSHPV